MKKCVFLLVATVVALSFNATAAEKKRVICYWGTWANYRPADGQFYPEDINPFLCTHIIYSFMKLQEDGSVSLWDSWLDKDLRALDRLNLLKLINPELKTIIAVGGWNEGSTKYGNAAADPAKRARFVQSALEIVKQYGYDGFDIDWEYPNQREGKPADKENFIKLLQEFRQVWDSNGLLLSIAVASVEQSASLSYNIPEVSKYVDMINVMAYDMHGAFDTNTGMNAPLYPSLADKTTQQQGITVDAGIRYWISQGADPSKINMGMPLYGRTFTLSDPNNKTIGAPISSGGTAGIYTRESGFLGYNEICTSVKPATGWTLNWDKYTKTPYAYNRNEWITYDDPESLSIKVQYAKALNLGGVMVWSVETDDFRGRCGPKWPLLNAIKTSLEDPNNDLPPPEDRPDDDDSSDEGTDGPGQPDQTTHTAAPSNPTDAPPTDSGVCTKAGSIVRDPDDCSKFYFCVQNDHNGIDSIPASCGAGLVFDIKILSCNYPSEVVC